MNFYKYFFLVTPSIGYAYCLTIQACRLIDALDFVSYLDPFHYESKELRDIKELKLLKTEKV